MEEVPKKFIVHCKGCGWREITTGLSQDLVHLQEIKKCKSCGGLRKFRCPKCSREAKMFRNAGNA